jgi:hypothetical protein
MNALKHTVTAALCVTTFVVWALDTRPADGGTRAACRMFQRRASVYRVPICRVRRAARPVRVATHSAGQCQPTRLAPSGSTLEAPSVPHQEIAETPRTSPPPSDRTGADWQDLFDGQQLGNWKPSAFGGEGDVYVENGRIILDFGQPLTGITYQGEVPAVDYELRLEAMRVDGNDFFCALTFPVGDSHCSFVVGGWGGSVVGISSIDGEDASENNTTEYRAFQKGVWYRIRVRVTDAMLEAWIDDQLMVRQELEGRDLSTRPEVDLSKPLGIASFDTQAAVRGIQLRRIRQE